MHAKTNICIYEPVTQQLRTRLANVDGNQPGDQAKAAALIFEVALSEKAPLRLLLGKPGYQVVEAKIQRMSEELATWKVRGRRRILSKL